MHRPAKFLAALMFLAAATLSAIPAQAQLFVIDEELYVTEVRPDHNKIGTSAGKTGSTRGWIKIEGRTKIYRRNGKAVSQATMWKSLKRGMKIKIHGGGDWDTNVVAKKIWY